MRQLWRAWVLRGCTVVRLGGGRYYVSTSRNLNPAQTAAVIKAHLH